MKTPTTKTAIRRLVTMIYYVMQDAQANAIAAQKDKKSHDGITSDEAQRDRARYYAGIIRAKVDAEPRLQANVKAEAERVIAWANGEKTPGQKKRDEAAAKKAAKLASKAAPAAPAPAKELSEPAAGTPDAKKPASAKPAAKKPAAAKAAKKPAKK